MGGIRHPFTGARYEPGDDGIITVTAGDGRRGRFRRNGQWISGDLRECDAQLCGWVGGPRVGHHRLAAATRQS